MAQPCVPSMCPLTIDADGADWARSASPFYIISCGAEGQNRTADTMIFSHVLYQLSYLGTSAIS